MGVSCPMPIDILRSLLPDRASQPCAVGSASNIPGLGTPPFPSSEGWGLYYAVCWLFLFTTWRKFMEGLKLTLLRAAITASTLVFGFLPKRSFLL